MVATFGRGGVVHSPAAAGFAVPTHRVIGNELPADSGRWPSTGYGEADKPGPSPDSPGYVIGGTAGGGNDGYWGSDPRAPYRQPDPSSTYVGAWGEGDPGSAPGGPSAPTGYATGATWDRELAQGYGQGGEGARLGGFRNPLAVLRPSWWRGGIQGFNDKLTVKDRHAYWQAGYQRQGVDFTPASAPPNTYNNPLQEGPQARLRTVNRTVSYQKGSDRTRNQDDLSRPYTWVGEQGSGWAPVYGGVPGLYIPYGSRGGVPFPIVDPTDGQGGRELVWAGPPHGLHSQTFPDTADTLRRYGAAPQMRPVRIDRPSNSPQAGQSYSQTVQFQGTTQGAAQPGGGPDTASPWAWTSGSRGWAGARRPPGMGG